MKIELVNDNIKYKNIEVGAGCGNFGQQYYPDCYLTDNDSILKIICKNCYIDYFCDAHQLPWPDGRFEKVILCNPYNFGFNDKAMGGKLLSELLRVLRTEGEIIIIGHSNNKFCTPDNVKRRLSEFKDMSKGVDMRINVQVIVSEDEYVGYVFKTTDGVRTNPNVRISINVKK